VTLALGDGVVGGRWLALHLVLLGAATNAIVVWSEHFATPAAHPDRERHQQCGGPSGDARPDRQPALRRVHHLQASSNA
jgi:hypothetical protein